MGRVCSFFILIFYVFPISSVIHELPHFDQINAFIDEETLVILDIDDTLLVPSQMVGCDEWFIKRLQLVSQEKSSYAEALNQVLFEWEGLRSLTEMILVEDSISNVIQSIQKRHIPTICLTTQRFALAPRTLYQLNTHEIDMTKTTPCHEPIFFMTQNLGVLFLDGVLFTNGTHKGKTLFQFCHLAKVQPKKIVFVNDKATHLREIESSCLEHGIPFIGLRYGYSDWRKKSFSYEIAGFQAENLSLTKIISDDEAKLKLGF